MKKSFQNFFDSLSDRRKQQREVLKTGEDKEGSQKLRGPKGNAERWITQWALLLPAGFLKYL